MSDKLYPGPVVEGRQVYFTLGVDIPEGWDWRSAFSSGSWSTWEHRRPDGLSRGDWVLVREPEPEVIEVTRHKFRPRKHNLTRRDIERAVTGGGDLVLVDSKGAAARVWRLLTEGS